MSDISAILTAGKFVGSLLFVVFLGAAVMAGALVMLTDESGTRDILTGVFDQALREKYSEQELQKVKLALQVGCDPAAGTIRQDFGEISLNIDCNAVRLGQAEDLSALFTDAYMDQVYFRTYSCDFVSCFNQAAGANKAAVLFSQHANSFFRTIMWAFAALAIIGIIIIFASVRHLFSALKIIGVGMIITGLPAFFVGGMHSLVPVESGIDIASLLAPVLTFLSTAYLAILGIGIILAVSGFVLASKWPPVKKSQARSGVQRSFTPRFGTEAQWPPFVAEPLLQVSCPQGARSKPCRSHRP